MKQQRYINDSIICYLSPKGQEAVKSLMLFYNMDFDLAIEVCNVMMEDEELWELPEIEEVEERRVG